MTTSSGSSSGSSSSSTSGMSETGRRRFTMPTPAYMAPAGASLGQTTTGGSLVSYGNGRAVDTSTGSVIGTATGTKIQQTAPARSLVSTGGGGGGKGGPIDTTVTQKPAENTTTETGGPRSDFSQVLAAQFSARPNRSPSRSTNFVSLVGGAGGLGRKSDNSKRTLIGGA